MTNIIESKINLMIDEPWEYSKLVEAKIVQMYIRDKKTYFLVEDVKLKERYVVTNRYEGDDLTDFSQGNKIIVAIALPSKGISSLDNVDLLSHITYFGVGSIELGKEQK